MQLNLAACHLLFWVESDWIRIGVLKSLNLSSHSTVSIIGSLPNTQPSPTLTIVRSDWISLTTHHKLFINNEWYKVPCFALLHMEDQFICWRTNVKLFLGVFLALIHLSLHLQLRYDNWSWDHWFSNVEPLVILNSQPAHLEFPILNQKKRTTRLGRRFLRRNLFPRQKKLNHKQKTKFLEPSKSLFPVHAQALRANENSRLTVAMMTHRMTISPS